MNFRIKKSWFKKTKKPDLLSFEDKQLSLKFRYLIYWTPELIEYIANTTDSLELSVGSCLINSSEWPDWIPSKPEGYNSVKPYENEVLLHFICEIAKLLENKSNLITPKLHNYIWISNYYRNHSFEIKNSKFKRVILNN